jgi:hypothetical protein
MLRPGHIETLAASSYNQVSNGSGEPGIIITLEKNNAILFQFPINNGTTSNLLTGLNLPFNVGEWFAVNVRNNMTTDLTRVSFYIGIVYDS